MSTKDGPIRCISLESGDCTYCGGDGEHYCDDCDAHHTCRRCRGTGKGSGENQPCTGCRLCVADSDEKRCLRPEFADLFRRELERSPEVRSPVTQRWLVKHFDLIERFWVANYGNETLGLLVAMRKPVAVPKGSSIIRLGEECDFARAKICTVYTLNSMRFTKQYINDLLDGTQSVDGKHVLGFFETQRLRQLVDGVTA